MNTQPQTKSALELAEEALQKLACLGNGDRYGNSNGNVIAQDALAAIQKEKEAPKQEPVAWTTMTDAADRVFVSGGNDPNGKLDGTWTPLYINPQPQSKLSEWRSVMPKMPLHGGADLVFAGYERAKIIHEITAALERLERGE